MIVKMKLFKKYEFIFLDDKDLKSGCFGEIVHVIHKESNTKMVIKKYKNNPEYPITIITQDAKKELYLLNFINKVDPNVAVNLYGIYIENDIVNLVYEPLQYTLDGLVDIMLKLDEDEFQYQLKNVFYNLLSNIKTINSTGIIHKDIKQDNIMIDNNSKLRMIDFGISDYIGVKLNKRKSNDVFYIGYVILGIIFKYKTGDLSSYRFDYFVEDDENLEDDDDIEGDVFVWYDDSVSPFFTLVDDDIFSDSTLRELLVLLFVDDPNNRWSAEDCLSHEYFTAIPYERSSKTELQIYKPIFLYSKNLNLHHHHHHHHTTNMIGNLNFVFTICNEDIDLFFNVVSKIMELNDLHPLNDKFLQYTIMVIYFEHFFLSDILFNSFTRSPFEFNTLNEKIGYISSEQELKEIGLSIIERTANLDSFIEFIPVTSTVNYLVLMLEDSNIDSNVIEQIKNIILNNIKIWVVYNNKYDLTIWDVIKAFYNTIEIKPYPFDENKVHTRMVLDILEHSQTFTFM